MPDEAPVITAVRRSVIHRIVAACRCYPRPYECSFDPRGRDRRLRGGGPAAPRYAPDGAGAACACDAAGAGQPGRPRDATCPTSGCSPTQGENAEAYFSPDGTHLIFQSSPDPVSCDQMYVMKIDGTDRRRVSNGEGRTTCGFFTTDARQITYASTHGKAAACPERPSMARGYVWPIFDGYDIYKANADGSGAVAADQVARLRRRSDDGPERAHRVHERARRRHGDLHHGRRRVGREAPDQPPRPGRRRVLLARRHADRLPGPPPTGRARPSSPSTSHCSRKACGGRPRPSCTS